MIEQFLIQYEHEIYVFILSMIPISELRGAIPLGFSIGMPWYEAFVTAVIGNSLVVPLVVLLGREIMQLDKKLRLTSHLFCAVERRTLAKQDVFQKYSNFGLILLVAIPLPGTGAWTGALLAALLNLRVKDALLACFIGVLIAGILVTAATYSLFPAIF